MRMYARSGLAHFQLPNVDWHQPGWGMPGGPPSRRQPRGTVIESQLWTKEVRDDLLDAASEMGELDDDEREIVIAAIQRIPLDTLIGISQDEWDRLNSEYVPMAERSDAALAMLVADLTYGPGQWIDSQEIGIEMGEWFTKDS